MVGFGGSGRRRPRAARRLAIAVAVVAGSTLTAYLPTRAEATLPGSVFNGADASPTSDLAAGAVALSDPVGNTDTSNFTGSNEDDLCPAIATGTASPKDDLDMFYVGTKPTASSVFVYMGWRRAALTGTTTIDFELNRSTGPKAACNGVNPARTAGDLLITYDFQGTGPFTLDIHQRTWIGTSAAGAWSAPSSIPANAFEASINNEGSFGELVVDLVAANVLSLAVCDTFGSAFPKSRSSAASFGSAIKEYVPPYNINASSCGSVSIHKQDDTGAALSGVSFSLYTNMANAPGVPVTPAKSCTTDASGNCTISNVIGGTYWVVEGTPPGGHTGAPPQKVTVSLTGNSPAGVLTFVNPRKPAKVDIVKRDDAGAALAGATFALYTDNAGAVGTAVSGKTCTTSNAGTCSITNILPPGTYWVVETVVPDGYTGAAAQKTTLGLDQTVTLTFVNTRKPATVNIVKKDDAGAFLAGATFGLYTDDNGSVGTAVSGKTCTTSTGGTCSIGNILPPGTYWVVETGVPAGHTAAPSQSVTLGLNQTVTLTFVDDRLPAQVDIVKKDDAGAVLAGATFGLFTDNAGAIGTAVSGKTCTTSNAGTCSITSILPPGTYWVSETGVPAGHTGAADQQVVLALNQTVTLNFVNTRKPAAVEIVKKDDAGALLAGAGFTLYTDNAGTVGTAVSGKTCTTSAVGTCSITNILPPGTYWVVETTTPAGHTTAAAQQVVLGLNQTLTVNFVNVRKPARVNILKKDDAGALLSGVKFDLHEDDNGTRGKAVPAKTCTTDAVGACSITGILPPGTYWVHEVSAPAGHTAAADQQITLALDQTVALTFVNPRKPATVNIVKKDDTGAALAGAGFTLHTDLSGAVGIPVADKSCVTSAAGTCSITGILPPGTYWVVETTTPAGHFTADPQKTTLALDQTVTLTFVNDRKPIGIGIVKKADGAVRTQADPLYTESGDEVGYELVITNTGQLPLTITSLTDSLEPDVLAGCSQGLSSVLNVGASFTCQYKAAPTDDAHNVASVIGTDVLGRTTSATAESFVVPLHPAIHIDKSGPSAAHVGDVVGYTLVVTNPGDTGLEDVAVTDDTCSDTPALKSKTGGNSDDVLEPGETWTYTCSYTVVEGDGASVTNVADVSGVDRLDTKVTDDDEFVFPVLHPAITLDKTASPKQVAVSGVVTFSYLVTNTGDTTLYDVKVTDDVLGPIGNIDKLEPGESRTVSTTMNVRDGSPTVNVGTAEGTDVLGKTVKSSDTETIIVVLGQTFVRVVELPRTGAAVERLVKLALTLLGAGFALRVAARRRRPQSTNA